MSTNDAKRRIRETFHPLNVGIAKGYDGDPICYQVFGADGDSVFRDQIAGTDYRHSDLLTNRLEIALEFVTSAVKVNGTSGLWATISPVASRSCIRAAAVG